MKLHHTQFGLNVLLYFACNGFLRRYKAEAVLLMIDDPKPKGQAHNNIIKQQFLIYFFTLPLDSKISSRSSGKKLIFRKSPSKKH